MTDHAPPSAGPAPTTRKETSLAVVVTVAALSALTVAAAGGALTQIGSWYRGLHKPAWTPPDAAFGVIWTTIFVLAATSGVLAWRGARPGAPRLQLIGLFALNGLLNMFWSLLFFAHRRPDLALWESCALWLSILALIVRIWPVSRLGSVLLLPYLTWVTIATDLNFEIVRLNGPFG